MAEDEDEKEGVEASVEVEALEEAEQVVTEV